MLDMDRRLAPTRLKVFVVLGLCLIGSGPRIGFWTLAPLIVAGSVFAMADRMTKRSARPEYGMFAAWAASEAIIGVCIAMTGGPKAAALPWLALPVVTLTARFSDRGIVAGVVFTMALLCGVTFGVDAGTVVSDPEVILAPAALILGVTMFSTTLMHSDAHHRSEAVIDQLTGMLNRKALATRTAELAQQVEVTGEPVAAIVGDLDHFKSVNDTLGHATGDAVLRDVAYVIRKCLRAFDLAYRLGGEEFLVLVPGADAAQASVLAEELRGAVQATGAGGTNVTMSFGVAASPAGGPFVWETVFAEADAALYAAKGAGRNRVRPATRVLGAVA